MPGRSVWIIVCMNFNADLIAMDTEDLLSINSTGQYCFSLVAYNDERVENQEVLIIHVLVDGNVQESNLSVTIIDDDCKEEY